jgi:class 3 adenylate cyclase/tetratricopeptide (TPR) repeat protein
MRDSFDQHTELRFLRKGEPSKAEVLQRLRRTVGEVDRPFRTPDPRSYTPKHLADRILAEQAAMESRGTQDGERKTITALFADIKGSVEMMEGLDPEEARAIVDPALQLMMAAVHRYEGYVAQSRGDGIFALFGAPIDQEDHARRALYAALRMQEEIKRYSDRLRIEKGAPLAIRVGLNSGEMVLRSIRKDDLHTDYVPIGHSVNLAARMEGLATPGSIAVAESTYRVTQGYFRFRELGPIAVKGVSEPIRVYELEGMGALHTPLEVSRSRGFSRFVGRVDEMGTLEVALTRAIAGNTQVVGIVGEPGVGKSRLCFEFLERCRARGIAIHEAHGVPHGKAFPLLPMLELFRNFFGITEQDPDQIAREKIAGRFLLLDESLREALPLIFDLLGVSDPEHPAPPMDPESRQRQLVAVVKRVTQMWGQRQPAVTFLEDLHWFDGGSERFLEAIVEALPGTQGLMLVNFRPEYHAAWMQKSYYQQLPLLPLGLEAIAELLQDLLGGDPLLATLGERIRARTGGNPFFMEEVVQTLAETGSLEGTKGAYRLMRPAAELRLPATVQAVLAPRIDRLAEREKQVLETAAVIGREFTEPVLRRVVELSEIDLTAALLKLTSAEFVYEQALYPQAQYTFKHALTQEVAYRSQLAERRARVHAAIARAIEEIDSGKLGESAALLAYHWEHAGDAREAAKWHRRAAEWVGFNNPVEALRHWGSARQLLDTLPETPENLAERAAVRALIMIHLVRLGDPEDQATSLFREGREFATRSGDPHVVSQVLNSFGHVRLVAGSVAEGLDLLLESIQRADETEDIGLRVAVRDGPCLAYLSAGRLSEGLAVAEQGLGLARGDLELGADRLGFSPSLGLAFRRGFALSLMGRPREGAAELDRVIELAHTSQQLLPLSFSHAGHVVRCEVTGDAVLALAHGREAVDYAERTGSQNGRIYAYLSLGLANVLNGAWHDAFEALGEALAIARDRRLPLQEGAVLAAMAAAHLGLGDCAKALALAEEAIAVCRRRGTRLREFLALLTRMRALRELYGIKATREIEVALAEADAWLEMSGAKSYEPFLHVERAELARLNGDEATRERELREAHRLFLEIGAPIRAAEVAKELGLAAAS